MEPELGDRLENTGSHNWEIQYIVEHGSQNWEIYKRTGEPELGDRLENMVSQNYRK